MNEEFNYLITLKPLEPYFFGSELNYNFGSQRRATKQTYLIQSLLTPTQTTLIGTVRFAVLAANKALINNNYDDNGQRERAAKLVGEKSFDMNESRDFGMIRRISPLFIRVIDHCDDHSDDQSDARKDKQKKGRQNCEKRYIPAPMNYIQMEQKNLSADCREKVRYAPFNVISSDDVLMSAGGGFYAEGFDAKKDYGSGWLDIYSGEVVDDLFVRICRTGINANKENSDDSGLFIKEFFMLKAGGEFAFYAQIDPEAARSLENGVIVYPGQNKSLFRLCAHAVGDKNVSAKSGLSWKKTSAKTTKSDKGFRDFENQIKRIIAQNCRFEDNADKCRYVGKPFYYALSDCRLNGEYSGFLVAHTRQLRYLRTKGSTDHLKNMERSKELYGLAKAGAVFYDKETDTQKESIEIDENTKIIEKISSIENDEICKKIGMNYLIKVGGEKK